MSVELGNLPISYEQLRSLVVEWLSQAGGGQLNTLRTAIASLAIKQGHVVDPSAQRLGAFGMQPISLGGYGSTLLSGKDYGRVQSIIWDLIIEGVVRPGLNDGSSNDLPFFYVTDFGKQRLKDGPKSPYDPDGYLRRLRTDIPDLDPVIVTYLNESLHTFRIGCLLSSAIALGCASEKALLLLIGAYADALPGAMQERFRKNTEGRMIKRQFDEFRKMLDSHLRPLLPSEHSDGLDVMLNAVFEVIRNQRNDAGHPTGKDVAREQAYASLVILPAYLRRVYDLMRWLRSAECKEHD